MYRLFVAIPIPDNIKERILGLQINIPGAKWTSDDQLHITLKFIGEVDVLGFKDIRDKLLEIKMKQFMMHMKGVGYFPPGNPGNGNLPKVLWAGFEGKQNLTKLRNGIENSLAECGFKREGRKFNPHITIARLKNTQIDRVIDFLTAHSTFKTESFIAEEFRLYSSKLYPRGAVHTIEAVYPLD